MLETLLCSLITILPDYLYRSRVQGKRWGHEINFFTLWYELRWGITTCAMLAITLITLLFYFHPMTSTASSFFRTVTILSESGGRVVEVYVENNEDVKAGDPIFRMDSSSQEAAVTTARSQLAELDAAFALAEADLAGAVAGIAQAEALLEQSQADLEREGSLLARGSNVVSQRDVEVLQNQVDGNAAGVEAAQAALAAVELRIGQQLPAQRATAEAALSQAEVELAKMTVYAATDGRIEQLSLRPGDIVNPILRPAGILVPPVTERVRFQAGFPQVATQVVKKGGVAEIMCISKPFTIVPMVIVEVQDVIAGGQIRPTDQLLDIQNLGAPGSITAFMEPLYEGQTHDIPAGSRCVAVAYTSFHDRLKNDDTLGFGQKAFFHVVETIGVVHAAGLRLRSIIMPYSMLVFSGH
ncbi:MAG: HlyD family secretion protein [Roseobacter sp.]